MAVTTHDQISVAVPWSMTHYIPLNGFHPLYRALFDEKGDGVTLNALDNVKLSKALACDEHLRRFLLKRTRSIRYKSAALRKSKVERQYVKYFDAINQVLSELLPGQIELHHTAPFPSLCRPFVFHCESFSPVFYPFAHQGTGPLQQIKLIRDHYGEMFSSDECLGIFSHIPETLNSLSRFFDNSLIDRKLQLSRIGISKHSLPFKTKEKIPLLPAPNFLFINSAHQNPENFFLRGGHIVLRFWKELRQHGIDGRLYVRCCRPQNSDLVKNGVDIEFLKGEAGRSIIWIEDYLPNNEMNALTHNAHLMLLPSISLHSLSIMQAMVLGAVPVVTDTIGASVYVVDDENGIVLQGVRKARWSTDPQTNIEFDQYAPDRSLDANLVSQLTRRVLTLLQFPETYEKIRLHAMERAIKDFSGREFSCEFWGTVVDLYARYKRNRSPHDNAVVHRRCLSNSLVAESDWSRLFESPTQPNGRLYTGLGRVSEFGGAFVAHDSPMMELHDWSPVRAYIHRGAPELQFSETIKGLQGKFIEVTYSQRGSLWFIGLIHIVEHVLKPYPTIYKFASRLFKSALYGYRTMSLKRTKDYGESPAELILEDVSGYNIIRYGKQFYAIPQSEGAFEYKKIKERGYSTVFIGHSVSKVCERIAQSKNSVRS